MSCTRPIRAYIDKIRSFSGSRILKFHNDKISDQLVYVPCGKCIGCRLAKALEWSTRITDEAEMWEHNTFITLTYDEENLPEHRSLKKEDFQNFMKRLRKKYYDKKIRYYMSGEYGDITERPHYHAILFNHDFGDKIYYKKNGKGDKIYVSPELTKIWGKGHCTLSDVTRDSASYCARYTMKKIYGEIAVEHYTVAEQIKEGDKLIAEIWHKRIPEYSTMSRGGRDKDNNLGGIGRAFYIKYKKDMFPSDFITYDGQKYPVPNYYLQILKEEDKIEFEKIKERRMERAKENVNEFTDERLDAKEKVIKAKYKQLKKQREKELN